MYVHIYNIYIYILFTVRTIAMFWFHKSSIRHTIYIYILYIYNSDLFLQADGLLLLLLLLGAACAGASPTKFAGQVWSENKNAQLPQIKTECTSWKWAHTIQIWICLLKIGRSHGKKPGSIETKSSHIKLRGHLTVKSKNSRPEMSSRNTHRHRAGRPKFVITSAGSKLGHCTAWWWWFYQVVPILNGLVVLGKS